MVKVRENLTGKIFGRLKVLEQAEDYISRDGTHYAQWLCQCNCEKNEPIIVRGICLRQGKTKSCGCIKKEIEYERSKKPNRYDLSGEYGVGYTNNTNKEFYFDLEDYDKIKKYYWYENVDNNGYHSVKARDFELNCYIKMPWVIAGKNYDHRNRNPFDNRKSNLRKSTYLENVRNHSTRKDNTSGFSGISWDKNAFRWRAYIYINRKQIYLGVFENKEDAIKIRLRAEKEHFGEFAPQRHLFEKYGI